MFDQEKIDVKFMKQALREAKKAEAKNEVPVGCVIVYQGKIIARGHNQRLKKRSVLAHAEIEAIAKANKKLDAWQLEDCDIYVTLEPCLMCAGAIIQARMKRLIYATAEPKFGVAESITNVFSFAFNHKVEVTKGVLKDEASSLLVNFFKTLRSRA